MALLLNETIQIHRHCDQRHIFTLELPESVTEPRSLIPCPSGPLSLPVSQIALDPIIKASVQLYPSDKSEDEPPTTPGVTPDATSFPKQSVQHISSALSSARIDTLLLSRTGLSSIHPQPLVQIAERHLSQKKTQEAQVVASAPYCPNELKAYIHLRLGLEYLYQTNFDEAGPCFVMACAFGTDPRLLIRLFPDLRLSHWSRSDSSTHAWTFAGAVEQLIKFSSIDALILANLMHNYSPHLDPQHDSENLIASLQTSSRQMIRLVCESYRAQNTWPRGEPEIKTAVLTALAKLEAEEGADEDYLARISEGASATDIEEWLEDRHSLHLLASLHSQTRNERKLLEIWSRIVDEQLEPLPPLQDILDTAKRQKDEGLRMHYAFWLVERETAIGLRALWDEPSLDSDAKRLSVYEQLQDRKSELAFEYLDGLVLESDHQVSTFVMSLRIVCLSCVGNSRDLAR